jgi:hypothetical protein
MKARENTYVANILVKTELVNRVRQELTVTWKSQAIHTLWGCRERTLAGAWSL